MTATFVSGTITMRLFQIRHHNQLMRELNRDAMETLRDEFLPWHFSTSAYGRYGGVFQKRSKRWQILKAKIVHHQRPNVWTGGLQAAVLAKDPKNITATATRARFKVRAPMTSKILAGPSAGKLIRRPLNEARRAEMEVVSDAERDALAKRQADKYAAAIFDPVHQVFALQQFRF